MTHLLLDVMLNAAQGNFPPVDGAVTFLPDLPNGNRVIVALTGHAFIAADLDAGDFDGIELDGFGAALTPAAVLRVPVEESRLRSPPHGTITPGFCTHASFVPTSSFTEMTVGS